MHHYSVNRKGIEEFVGEDDARICWRVDSRDRLKLYPSGVFVESLTDALARVRASLVNQITRGGKYRRVILFEGLQQAVREMACACARFKDRPAFGRA